MYHRKFLFLEVCDDVKANCENLFHDILYGSNILDISSKEIIEKLYEKIVNSIQFDIETNLNVGDLVWEFGDGVETIDTIIQKIKTESKQRKR